MTFFKIFTLAFFGLLPSFLSGVEIDTSLSQFTWKGTKIGGEHFGRIFVKESKLIRQGKQITGGKIVMNMQTFTVDDIKGEWAKKLLKHLKNPDFFNVKKFPTATLEIKKVIKDQVKAVLTIKGKSHPVDFKVSKKDKFYEGTMTFDRTKFDMTYKSKSFFKNLGDKIIHDPVQLSFKVAIKEPIAKKKKK